MKRFRAGIKLGVIVVLVACILWIAVMRRDLSLEHHGRRIASTRSVATAWTWLTNHSILVCDAEPVKATPGPARIIDTRTGAATALPFRFKAYPVSLSASPDGSMIVWDEWHSTYVHLDRVDGSQQVSIKGIAGDRVSSLDSYSWLPDGSHFLKLEAPDGTDKPQRLISRSVRSPYTATVISLPAVEDQLFSTLAVPTWADARRAVITENDDLTGIQATTWALSLGPPVKVHAKYAFHMPGSLSYLLWIGSLSPDGTRVALVLDTVEHPPVLVETLRRMHIPVRWHARQLQSVWVCSLTGRGGHEAAHIDVPPSAAVPGGKLPLDGLKWSPDGKQLGCMTTSGLYVVDAD
jgi:hypothetical protein